jgi:hypothetical protein
MPDGLVSLPDVLVTDNIFFIFLGRHGTEREQLWIRPSKSKKPELRKFGRQSGCHAFDRLCSAFGTWSLIQMFNFYTRSYTPRRVFSFFFSRGRGEANCTDNVYSSERKLMILSEHIAIQRELLPAKDMDKDAQSTSGLYA